MQARRRWVHAHIDRDWALRQSSSQFLTVGGVMNEATGIEIGKKVRISLGFSWQLSRHVHKSRADTEAAFTNLSGNMVPYDPVARKAPGLHR